MIVGVTGSEGRLGRATTRRLSERGHTVVGFDLHGPAVAGFTRVDLADYGQTLDAFLGVTARHDGLDAIVHLAAVPVNGLIPDVTTFENNVTATFHVLFAAHRSAERLPPHAQLRSLGCGWRGARSWQRDRRAGAA